MKVKENGSPGNSNDPGNLPDNIVVLFEKRQQILGIIIKQLDIANPGNIIGALPRDLNLLSNNCFGIVVVQSNRQRQLLPNEWSGNGISIGII